MGVVEQAREPASEPVHVTLGPPPGVPRRHSEASWERADASLHREKTAGLFPNEYTSSKEQDAERAH